MKVWSLTQVQYLMEALGVNYQQLAVYQVGRLQENPPFLKILIFNVLGHATQFYTGPRDFDIPGGDFFTIVIFEWVAFFLYKFSCIYDKFWIYLILIIEK